MGLVAWEPVVSVQFAVLEAGRVVWATAEENGAAGTRWTLWYGGRCFTLRGDSGTFEHATLDDDWLSGSRAPLAAQPLGDESYRVELRFYRSTHIGSATGTTRLTFYLRTMTVRESVRGIGVSLHDYNENATATGYASWPGSAAPEPDYDYDRIDSSEVPAMREVPTDHLGFTLELRNDADVEALATLLNDASSSGLVRIARWRVHSRDVGWTPAPGTVASAVREAAGCEALQPVDGKRGEVGVVDAERMAGQYLQLEGAMPDADAAAGAALFLAWFSSAARFFLFQRFADVSASAVIAVDGAEAAVLSVFDFLHIPGD